MKTLKIRLKEENFKRIMDALQYQLDNYKHPLNVAKFYKNQLEGSYKLSEEEILERKEYIKKFTEEFEAFLEMTKKINGKGKLDVELEDAEFDIFLKCLENQMGYSKYRLKDFKEDRFRWGKDKCKVLIDDETKFWETLNYVYKKAKI